MSFNVMHPAIQEIGCTWPKDGWLTKLKFYIPHDTTTDHIREVLSTQSLLLPILCWVGRKTLTQSILFPLVSEQNCWDKVEQVFYGLDVRSDHQTYKWQNTEWNTEHWS